MAHFHVSWQGQAILKKSSVKEREFPAEAFPGKIGVEIRMHPEVAVETVELYPTMVRPKSLSNQLDVTFALERWRKI